MNTPYVKKYNNEGVCINPITKDKPYLNYFKSNRGNNRKQRIINNRKPMSDREVISRLMFVQKINKLIKGAKTKLYRIAFHRNPRFN